jgi:deoxyribose-phosphate aldolase
VSEIPLDRLIDIIVGEVLAAGGPARAVRCACHAVMWECCPDRLRSVLDAGAARLGLHASGGHVGDVASIIDHTLLRPDASRSEIEALCREAVDFGFATVCVNPAWVSACAHHIQQARAGGRGGSDGTAPGRRSSGVPAMPGVCSVVGFPLGATMCDVKAYETRRAIVDGATEIDMVINVGALKSGELALVARDIEAVTTPCRAAGVVSKVIIEAALLTDEEKVAACTLAMSAGADYVKTSTGFGPGGATAADVALMRRVVGAGVGVKAAGGVRDLQALSALVAAGATRIGASAGVRIVQESRGAMPSAMAQAY